MIDPKYAHLPGIDASQPDLFETSDLPESDQPDPAGASSQPHSGDGAASADAADQIETLKVDVKDVYGMFKDKRVDASKVDFSDKVGASTKSGYEDAIQLQINMDRAHETLEMRFKRLQLEMQELSEDLNRVEKAAGDDARAEQISPALLHQNVAALQSQLHSLHLQKNVGGKLINLTDPSGNIEQKLKSQIEQIKAAAQKDAKAGKSGSPIYELYAESSGESADAKTTRVSSLEQRIARLESTLGNNPEKLAMLKAENGAEGLLQAVEELQTKVNLLNPKVVDLVDGRLGALQLRLQQIGEKKAANAAVAGGQPQQQQQLTEETAKRIEEIHGQVEKWESVCSTLPNIADRMATLNDLHNRAVTFSQTLQQLEAMQKTISGNLTTQSTLVTAVEATLAENLDVIGKNCKALDARIAKLKT